MARSGSLTPLTRRTIQVLIALLFLAPTAQAQWVPHRSDDVVVAAIGWVGGQDPNNAPIVIAPVDMTIVSISGNVETALGATGTVRVNRADDGVSCERGLSANYGSLDVNGTTISNQSLPVAEAFLPAGARLCLQTTGGANWTGGHSVAGLTVTLTAVR